MEELREYELIDLPEEQVLWDKMRAVDSMKLSELEDAKTFLFDTADKFERVLDSFSSVGEAMEDPNMIANGYERYRIYSGGLLGLVKASERKLKELVYAKLIKDNANAIDRSEKTTAGDREIFMRGAAASLEGLITRLEKLDEVLKTRSYRTRSK